MNAYGMWMLKPKGIGFFKIYVLFAHNNPEASLKGVGVEKALSLSCNSTERESVLRRLRVTALGEASELL